MFRSCGWFGSLPSGVTPEYLISQTSIEFFDGEKWTIMPDAAVSGADFKQAYSIVSNDQYVAIIGGRHYWDDKELNDIVNSQSAADALIAAYKKYSVQLFKKLRGNFSFALFDRSEKQSILAIDKLGINNLSYILKDGALYFGTDASSVANISNSKEISNQSLFNYLFFHVIPSPGTIYKGIHKLEPAHYLLCKDNNISIKRYWTCEFNEDTSTGISAFSEELHTLLRKAVNHCNIDSKTGAFLSGGIDSSTVAGILSEFNSTNTNTYTIGFDAEGYDETSYAKTTSSHFNTKYSEYKVTRQDVVDIVPKISEFYDEPFGNSSAVPVFYCANLAKSDGMTSMLAGDGGDELFAGNTRYVREQIFNIYSYIPAMLRKKIIEPVITGFPGKKHISLLRKAQSYINHANIQMPDRTEAYNYLSRTPVDDVCHAELLHSINEEEPYNLLREIYNHPNTKSILNRMLFLDWKFTLADNDLKKVNGMCHMAGIDVSYPLLDEQLLDFSARLPANVKIKNYKLRSFFKNSMQGYLPDRILNKSKHGFGLPFGVWMKEYQPMKELAYDNLAGLKKRNIMNPEYLDKLMNLHQTDHAHYYGEFIWVLMMLELWLTKHNIS